MKKSLIIGVVAVVLILAAGAGFWKWNSMKKAEIVSQKTQEEEQSKQKKQDNTDIDTSNWKKYTSGKYGFEIKYPEDWEIDEYDGITFSYKVSQEIRKLGDSEIAKKLSGNKNGDLSVNISVYPGIKKYFNDIRDWKKNDANIIQNNGEGYYFKNFPFANDVLVIPEKKGRTDNLRVATYYFFQGNDGCSVTVFYSKDSNGLAEKMLSTLKFNN